MEKEDLKVIKKKYGEKMSHLCRELFPTILENEGELSNLMLDNFEPSKFLYEDIIKSNSIENFKNYVYSKYIKEQEAKEVSIEETPEQLMAKVGYILKECHTEEEMQVYKKYYKEDEVICTLERIGRLKKCRVFFAVKKNVDEIKRENFKYPRRQDEYGTSVISIQFSKDASHYLSIKNRYNHTVEDCDATFSNDLDNIVAGLTDSFAYHYGLKQRVKQGGMGLLGYTQDVNGKYYKYNYEINNVYYCPNNIIIYNGVVKKFDKEKFIVIDYFILDLVNKRIIDYSNTGDSFTRDLNNIKKITVINEQDNKIIIINIESEKPIVIKLDKYNRITGYFNDNLFEIKNQFMIHNRHLKEARFSNIKKIGNYAFYHKKLTEFYFPNCLIEIGDYAFAENNLKQVIMPDSVVSLGSRAYANNKIEILKFSNNITYIGEGAFANNKLISLTIPKNNTIIKSFTYANNNLIEVNFHENVKEIEIAAFGNNQIKSVSGIENVEKIDQYAFLDNIFDITKFQSNLKNK